LLIGIGLAAYFNSFAGSFLLDDKLRIIDNPQIRRLWPLWAVMAHSTRPILELSLALNYAVGGLNPWTYHAFNLAVHLSAGLLLFGIVRRMLESDRLRARYGDLSRWLAIAVAAIWLVHPLQTESVTYIIQRAESLMGVLFLMTMYCGIRACGPFASTAMDHRCHHRLCTRHGHQGGDGLGANPDVALRPHIRCPILQRGFAQAPRTLRGPGRDVARPGGIVGERSGE
jgi:hypothetical protein